MRSSKIAAVFCSLFLAITGFATTAKSATIDKVLTAIHKDYQPTIIDDLDDTQQNEIICLALNQYHEARGSSKADIMAVGLSTRNRVKNSSNQSFCDTIWEKGQYIWSTRPLKGILPKERAAWQRMVEYARDIVMDDDLEDTTHGANSFYSRKLRPIWARHSPIHLVIGQHIYVALNGY